MELSKYTILVTMDVSALYKNIPQDEGVEFVRKVLNEGDVQNILIGTKDPSIKRSGPNNYGI